VKKMATLRRVRDTLAVAEECLDPEARFHFPHHLDWRGRMYPAVELLNPQGGDLARALLLFAEGKPIGESGVPWLAIHGANCFGERGTLDQRVQWTEEYTKEIVGAAADPLSSELLANTKTKSRLQCYAFALEWSRFQEHLMAGQAASDFVSSLPCGQDHTCSGVQHIAALLRSKKLARATNVLPGRPRDFYETVTKGVVRRLKVEDQDGEMQARMWLRGEQVITRDLIKKFAMTFEYGATSFGFGSDIGAYVEQEMERDPELKAQEPMYREDPADVFEFEPYPESMLNQPPLTAEEPEEIKRRREELKRLYGSAEGPRPHEDPELEKILDWAAEQHYWSERARADNYLARITEEVMKQETKAREWFRDCAKAIAETNQPVSWTVPVTGFEVAQNGWNYMKKERTGRPRAGGSQLVVLEMTDDVLPAKQANGLAPNVIHSLDAANLVLAINGLPADTPLGTAHDCYYVRAADAEQVNQTVRSAFVQLHNEPVLDQLHAQFSALAGRELPKPRKGKLDVSAALDSEYMLS
jgi:DNA-directed RNA polymerase